MTGSAISELSAARNVARVDAAFFETTVQVWDVTRQQKICETPARYDSGAANLAMHPDGECIVTGISTKSGTIAGYRSSDGALLWQRGKLPYPSRLRFSPSGDHVFCTIHDRQSERIGINTGLADEIIKGANRYIDGPYGHLLIGMKSVPTYLIRGNHEFQVPRLTFALLDASFAPDGVCLTESGGPVRCVDYLTGTERWRFDPPPGSHVLRLHYSPRDEFFYGVLRHYEKGLFRHLLRFDPLTGDVEKVCDLNSWEEAFIEVSHQVVTSAGDIVDLSSGQVVSTLRFPQKQYPDKPFRL